MHLESNAHPDFAQFASTVESHAATLSRLERELSHESKKASLSPDRLTMIKSKITVLNQELQQLMKPGASPFQSQIEKNTAKLQGMHFKFLRPAEVAALKAEIKTEVVQAAKVQNKLMLMTEMTDRLIKDAGEMHIKAQERFTSLVMNMPDSDLISLQHSLPDQERKEVVQSYRQILAKECRQLSPDVKAGILKAVIASQVLQNPIISYTVNDRVENFLVDKTKGGAVIREAKFLGQGADAKAFLVADMVFKFARPVSENPSSLHNLQKDVQVLTHLTSGKGANPESPGFRCVEEFHGAKVLGREHCMFVKYYENGSFQKQVHLELFASTLGLKDADFKAENKHERIDAAIETHKNSPAFKQTLSGLTEFTNISGQKNVTEDEMLSHLTRELKTHFAPLDHKERWQMVVQVASGAQYMIDAGIVHGDVRPGNIRWEKGHFVHGDFGQSSFIDDIVHIAQKFSVEPKRDRVVGEAPDISKLYNAKAQFGSLNQIFSHFPLSSSVAAEHTITSFDNFMDRLAQAGICSRGENGRLAINPYQADVAGAVMSAIGRNALTSDNIKKHSDFLDKLESAGFIKKMNGNYSLNINVSEEVKTAIAESFNFLILPSVAVAGQKEYAAASDEARLVSLVWEGGTSGEIRQVIESINTFSVGFTIIEGLTSKRPEKNTSSIAPSITQAQWETVKGDLKGLGFSDAFCDIVYEMVRDQGMPAESLESVLLGPISNLSAEEKENVKNEFAKVRRGEIALDQSELLKTEAAKHGISHTALVYNPRLPLAQLTAQLFAECQNSGLNPVDLLPK